MLGPVGLHERERFATYGGTEEVVYLQLGDGDQYLGLRPADGGEHRDYEVGLEHLAFYVDTRQEVDAAYQRCLAVGARVHFPPEEDRDIRGYCEMFVFDPDGHRIEVACGPEQGAPNSFAAQAPFVRHDRRIARQTCMQYRKLYNISR